MQSWTSKRAAAKSRRKIEAARKLFLEIASEWGEVDHYIVTCAKDAIEALDVLKEAINERPETGE